MRHLMLFVVIAAAVSAQDAKPDPKQVPPLDDAMWKAAKFLVGWQERYEPDRRVRRFRSNEKLEEWRENETKRLEKQRKKHKKNREWPYEGVYRVRGQVPPGYRVGGTSIVCWALMELPGWEREKGMKQAVDRGLKFVLDQFAEEDLLGIGFVGGYDVRGWAHEYGLLVLLKAIEKKALTGPKLKKAKKRVRWLLKALTDTEIPENGGWNYSRRPGGKKPSAPSTFMTASTLLALYEARAAGFKVSDRMVDRALDCLERGRAKNGAMQYSVGRGGPGGVKTPGACARMAVSETALYLAGRSDLKRMRFAVDAFFEHWGELEKRRGKQGTHEGPYGIAPYYFHFGHTYVALAIELLPEQVRPELRRQLQNLYWKTREQDGSWNDRIFPRSKGYSTAMAILGLNMPNIRPPAPWKPAPKK